MMCQLIHKLKNTSDLLRRHEKTAHNIDAPRRKRAHSTSGVTEHDLNRKAVKTIVDGNQGCARCQHYPLAEIKPSLDPPASLNGARRATTDGNVSFDSQDSTQTVPVYQQPIPPTQLAAGGVFQEVLQQPNGHEPNLVSLPIPTEQNFGPFDYPSLDPFELFSDSDNIFENVDFSSLFLPQGFALDTELQVASTSDAQDRLLPNGYPRTPQGRDAQSNEANTEPNSISRFGSPLPSVRPRRNEGKFVASRSEFLAKPIPVWKVTTADYADLKIRLSSLASVLPRDFTLPSKHTLSRYLEGCIKGLFAHMPNVHIPTWSVATSSSELLLSMAAIGAQFRFERHMAVKLFYAAKSAIMNQLQAIRDEQVVGVISRGHSFHSPNNGTSPRSSFHSNSRYNHPMDIGESPHTRQRLQTMQAIISLMVLGSWASRELVGEAIAFQSLLAELVRGDGLGPERRPAEETTGDSHVEAEWKRWIRAESLRRTKLMAFTFINLQSVAYNISPCMSTSEIRINTPASQEEWMATTPEAWSNARRLSKIPTTSFADAFRSLFQPGESGLNTPILPSSAIGNYALIFGILQTIFFLREGCATILPNRQDTRNLRPDDIESLSQALQNWQSRWENSPESNNDPQSSFGPVAFNSTALLRLAWIRVYSDLGPCRSLATRNPHLIVEAFKSCPPLHRQPGLTPALLHAAHALSVPVRLGIQYVAQTQTLSWSVQHSMANLEGCIFLSKWFEAVDSTLATTPLTSQEARIIHLIRSIVLESGFFCEDAFAPAVDERGWHRLIQHIGTAVASLWARVFSSTHVFELVSIIGTSLNMYARLLEDAHTPLDGYI